MIQKPVYGGSRAPGLSTVTHVFAGLPLVQLGKLHMILCSAASFSAGVTRHDHITDYTKSVLHWLPYPAQDEFCIILRKSVALYLIGSAPSHLSVITVIKLF